MWVCVALIALTIPSHAQEQSSASTKSAGAAQTPIGVPAAKQAPATASAPKQDIASQTNPLAGSPAQSIANQPLQPEVSAQIELEKELTKLATKLNSSLEPKKDDKITLNIFVDFLTKLVTLVATILGCFVTYKGLIKIPAVRSNSEILIFGLGAVVVLVLFYLLSGLVTSVLYVLVAILILLIALVLAAAHFIKFIDEKYPDVKDSIIAHFTESSADASLKRNARNNLRMIRDWLSSLSFTQQIHGEPQLELIGAFAEGYKRSVFTLSPNDVVAPFWKNVDDRLLVPVMISVTFYDEDNNVAELVNIQPGLVVVREGDSFKYVRFDNSGFRLLGVSLMEKHQEWIKGLLEKQNELSSALSLLNSQLA